MVLKPCICVFVYLCICVFSCETLANIDSDILVTLAFQKYSTCHAYLHFPSKLYLCICVFVYLCICICVFGHPRLISDQLELFVTSPFSSTFLLGHSKWPKKCWKHFPIEQVLFYISPPNSSGWPCACFWRCASDAHIRTLMRHSKKKHLSSQDNNHHHKRSPSLSPYMKKGLLWRRWFFQKYL